MERRQLPRVGWDTDPKHRCPGLQRGRTQQLLFRTLFYIIQNGVNDRPIPVPLGWVTLLPSVYSVINDGVYRHVGRWANNEVARVWQPLWPTSTNRHFLDVPRKIMKSLRHGSRFCDKIREQDHRNTKCSPLDNNVWYYSSGVDQTNVDRAARGSQNLQNTKVCCGFFRTGLISCVLQDKIVM